MPQFLSHVLDIDQVFQCVSMVNGPDDLAGQRGGQKGCASWVLACRTPHTVHGAAHTNNRLFYQTQQDGSVGKVLALQE